MNVVQEVRDIFAMTDEPITSREVIESCIDPTAQQVYGAINYLKNQGEVVLYRRTEGSTLYGRPGLKGFAELPGNKSTHNKKASKKAPAPKTREKASATGGKDAATVAPKAASDGPVGAGTPGTNVPDKMSASDIRIPPGEEPATAEGEGPPADEPGSAAQGGGSPAPDGRPESKLEHTRPPRHGLFSVEITPGVDGDSPMQADERFVTLRWNGDEQARLDELRAAYLRKSYQVNLELLEEYINDIADERVLDVLNDNCSQALERLHAAGVAPIQDQDRFTGVQASGTG